MYRASRGMIRANEVQRSLKTMSLATVFSIHFHFVKTYLSKLDTALENRFAKLRKQYYFWLRKNHILTGSMRRSMA